MSDLARFLAAEFAGAIEGRGLHCSWNMRELAGERNAWTTEHMMLAEL